MSEIVLLYLERFSEITEDSNVTSSEDDAILRKTTYITCPVIGARVYKISLTGLYFRKIP